MTLVPLVPLSPRHLSDVRSPAERAREEQAFYEEHANAWKIALGGLVPISLVLILFGALTEIAHALH